ncbi:MAG: hypothetical protein ACFFBP_05230 [Promethearchaeota archaeon]
MNFPQKTGQSAIRDLRRGYRHILYYCHTAGTYDRQRSALRCAIQILSRSERKYLLPTTEALAPALPDSSNR